MIESQNPPSANEGRFTLRKAAKLRHRTLVQDLFKKGKTVYSGPLRATFRTLTSEQLADSFREGIPDKIAPVQIMITVPKKKRRRAVDRVLLRRRIREAFRIQYHSLRQDVERNPDIRTLSVAIVYVLTENSEMPVIYSAVSSVIDKISKKLPSVISGDASSGEDWDNGGVKTVKAKPLL